VRDRARSRLPLPSGADLRREPHDARVDVAVAAGVHGVVEEQLPAGANERAPALEVRLRPVVGVVAVDEEQLEWRRRRLDRARVRDDEVHLGREPESLERTAQLVVELRAGHVGPKRHVEVVRPELGAVGERRREDQRAATLEAADLRDRAGLHVAGEPVEERRLVELQRRDAVVQLVRGEHEREVLEPAQLLRPALDVREAHRGRVRQDGGVDQVLSGGGAPEAADDVFHAGHAAERYSNVCTYAHAWRSPAGRQSASTAA
jgi:hypothetical protein